MGFVGDVVGGIFGGGDDPSDAARDASQIQADYQTKALEYLKETEKLPQEFREGALSQLAGLYGVPGGTGGALPGQQERIDLALQSPVYNAIMGGQKAGEEAIMRQAGATGGLRSGNVQENLYDYNTQLQNQALSQAYNQQITDEQRKIAGLQGLGQLPSGAGQIAGMTAGIGQTLGQGIVGAEQSQQASNQQGWGNLMGLAGLFF